MLYREYIGKLKHEWTGKKVSYQGVVYTVVDIDYNGCLLIDKPKKYHDSYTQPTTAILFSMIDD